MDWLPLYSLNRQSRGGKEVFPYWDQVTGINQVIPAKMLRRNEFVSLTNVKLNDFGQLQTRDGLTRVSTKATGNDITHLAYIPISTATNVYAVDSDYKLYKFTGSEGAWTYSAALGTLEGDATILPFGGYAVILDGGYIKYYNGTNLLIAYDDGDGTSGYNYTSVCNTIDATQNLYSGAKTLAGAKTATQTWTAGYTIPLTTIEVWISKFGSPTGNITAYMYNAAGDTLLATSTTTYSSAALTTGATRKIFTFDGSVNMSSNTTYIWCVGYSGGDATNYVKVHGTTVGSGGQGIYYSGAAWSTVATFQCCIGVKPGKPPKGAFGDVKDSRLFVAGDSDNPGYMWYSNINSVFDWSTEDGGGYISAVDDNAVSFPIGGIVAHYGELYIFGEESQPYLSKLTGTGPADWSLPPTFQNVSANHRSIVSFPNDIWFTSGQGVHNIQGVQEYGDIRSFNPGDPVFPTIHDYYANSTTFAGYNPSDGQYIVKLSGYTNALVCHTKHPMPGRNPMREEGAPSVIRYPWTEYEFQGLTATTFAAFNNTFYVGCSDGYIYKLDSSQVDDNGSAYSVTIESGFNEFPFGTAEVTEIYNTMTSNSALSGTLSFYKDGNTTAFWNMTTAASDHPAQYLANFNCESLKIKLHTLTFTAKSTFHAILLKVRRLLYRGV